MHCNSFIAFKCLLLRKCNLQRQFSSAINMIFIASGKKKMDFIMLSSKKMVERKGKVANEDEKCVQNADEMQRYN